MEESEKEKQISENEKFNSNHLSNSVIYNSIINKSIRSIRDLDKLNNEEIKEALQNENILKILTENCHGDQLNVLLNNNNVFKLYLKNIAEENLKMKIDLEKKKECLMKKLKEWKTLHENLNEKKNIFEQKLMDYDLQSLSDNMKVAMLECEEEAEKSANLFLNGNQKADSFLKTFIEHRKKFHLRKIKEEQINNLMNN